MPVEVKGVCKATISIEGHSDFVSTRQLETLKIQSEVGNVLPRMVLIFRYDDESLEKQLNEGNVIDVIMGTTMDAPDRIESKFRIVTAKAKNGRAEILAAHDSFKYVNTPAIKVFAKKKASEVIKTIAEQSYKVDISAASEDKAMDWKQAFISDKKMVDLCLTHFWMEKDVPLVGITEKGTFLLKSASKIASGEYKVKLTNNPKGSKDYVWEWREVEEHRALNNATTGYGRSKRVFDAETGLSKMVSLKPQLRLATASQIPTADDVKMAPGQSVQKSENTHDKWEEAQAKNQVEWDSLSSLKMQVYNHKNYIPINVLDLVMFEEVGKNKEVKETYTGLYIVTLITRTISLNQFSTYMEICRESVTDPKGKFDPTSNSQLMNGFLNNRLSLSAGRVSSSKSSFLQALTNDAIDKVNLSGSGEYNARAIDELIAQLPENKAIINGSTESIYDNMRGMIDSENTGKLQESFLSGYEDFLAEMEGVNLQLDPDNYPPEMRQEIDDLNAEIPDINLIEEFEGAVFNEGQELARDLQEAVADVGDVTDRGKIMSVFGSDTLSGMGSVNDILNIWKCNV